VKQETLSGTPPFSARRGDCIVFNRHSKDDQTQRPDFLPLLLSTFEDTLQHFIRLALLETTQSIFSFPSLRFGCFQRETLLVAQKVFHCPADFIVPTRRARVTVMSTL